jgi:hypothetical protein
MARKLAQKFSPPRHSDTGQDLPGVRLPDSSFPANSQQQVVQVAEGQRAANSQQQVINQGRDTSEFRQFKKAGFGQEEPKPKVKSEAKK